MKPPSEPVKSVPSYIKTFSGVFIVRFELITLSVFIVYFEQVNASWVLCDELLYDLFYCYFNKFENY